MKNENNTPEFKDILKEATKDILSDEHFSKITEAFDNAVVSKLSEKEQVIQESVTAKLDEQYTKELKQLLEDIDSDHTTKLERVVEALENKHTEALKEFINKVKIEYVSESKKYMDTLVNKIDKFFDLTVSEMIPQAQINEAVENTYYKKMYNKLRGILSVGEISHNDIVKEGVLEAQNIINEKDSQLKTLNDKVNKLLTENKKMQSKVLLIEKTKGLPKDKIAYINRVLGNKDAEFITENFDLTLKMYDKADLEETETLKASAKQNSRVVTENIDRPEEVIEESVTDNDPYGYLTELQKFV